jgi:hypothetical protein
MKPIPAASKARLIASIDRTLSSSPRSNLAIVSMGNFGAADAVGQTKPLSFI